MSIKDNGWASASAKLQRHVYIQYLFIKDKIESNGTRTRRYCNTTMMLADFLTKPLKGCACSTPSSQCFWASHHYLPCLDELLPPGDKPVLGKHGKSKSHRRQNSKTGLRSPYLLLRTPNYVTAMSNHAHFYSIFILIDTKLLDCLPILDIRSWLPWDNPAAQHQPSDCHQRQRRLQYTILYLYLFLSPSADASICKRYGCRQPPSSIVFNTSTKYWS